MKFKIKKIEDICSIVTDYVANGSFKSLADNVKYLDNGYARVIRLVDFNNNYKKKDSIWVDKDAYNFLSKSKLFGEEIILTNVGANLGTVFLAPNLKYPMTLGPNAIMMKTNEECYDRFLYYWLKSEVGQRYISSIVTGSAMPKFNKTDFRNIEIQIPDKKVQEKIITILTTLDKKIEENTATNNNLLEIIQRVITEKFYNDKLELVPISHFGKIQGGYAFKSKDLLDEKTKNRIIKIKNINTSSVDLENTQYILDNVAVNVDKKFQLLNGNVVIAMTGAELGKTGFIYGTNDKYFLNQRVGVVRGNSEIEELYLNQIFLLDSFQKKLNSKGYGSAQPNISTSDIENIEIPNSSLEELNKFYKLVNPMYNMMIENSIENKNLEQLRYTLLPKLVNGEIDLENIEI